MRLFAGVVTLMLSYAFFLLSTHFSGWMLHSAAGHFSLWQRQMADWLFAGP